MAASDSNRRRVAAWSALVLTLGMIVGCTPSAPPQVLDETSRFDTVIELPDPSLDGDVSLEAALAERRSAREYDLEAIPDALLGQLLWAGQGITDDEGRRTAPSAGARYPIELYAITADSVMHYLPGSHQLEERTDGRVLDRLGDAAFGQEFVREAPLVIAIVAVPSRTEEEYGAVAEPLVDRESGHVAQNILLQATVLDLAAVPVGGFDPATVAELLALPPGHDVRYLMPIG